MIILRTFSEKKNTRDLLNNLLKDYMKDEKESQRRKKFRDKVKDITQDSKKLRKGIIIAGSSILGTGALIGTGIAIKNKKRKAEIQKKNEAIKKQIAEDE